MLIGYGKIGRSMPLRLEKCGHLGGDVEMVATVKDLALRHPTDTFILIGRNSGEVPQDVGLPSNVINPWLEWAPVLRKLVSKYNLRSNFTIEQHLTMAEVMREVTGDIFSTLDQLVLWVGQHGTSNTPLPVVQRNRTSTLTKPQDAFAHYASYLLRGVNEFRDRDPIKHEPIILNSDVRNYLKMRDMAWPLRHPVLSQMNFTHDVRFERGHRPVHDVDLLAQFTGARVIEKNGHALWEAPVRNSYSRLEIGGLVPGTPFGDLVSFNDDWSGRSHFGLFINETRPYVSRELRRAYVMREWILPCEPTWIHGSWTDASLDELQLDIRPAPWDQYFPKLHSVRSTFTTPASGSGFATAKPWEAFAAGTVCFFHPHYDTQNNILRDAPSGLSEWLRVDTPRELRLRITHLSQPEGQRDWEWIVAAQRAHFLNALRDRQYIREIEARIYE